MLPEPTWITFWKMFDWLRRFFSLCAAMFQISPVHCILRYSRAHTALMPSDLCWDRSHQNCQDASALNRYCKYVPWQKDTKGTNGTFRCILTPRHANKTADCWPCTFQWLSTTDKEGPAGQSALVWMFRSWYVCKSYLSGFTDVGQKPA